MCILDAKVYLEAVIQSDCTVSSVVIPNTTSVWFFLYSVSIISYGSHVNVLLDSSYSSTICHKEDRGMGHVILREYWIHVSEENSSM
jgi:hypothetical protein